jgi:hypothetical protein
MRKSFGAPRTIRRIAARRVFQSAKGNPVVLTLGVPEPVPGSDWGCAVQITGMKTSWRRPKYIFGVDGLQALHLAMKCAASVLESAEKELVWLGQKGDLGLPIFLPELPTRQKRQLESLVEREAVKFWRSVERATKAAAAKPRTRGTRTSRRQTS